MEHPVAAASLCRIAARGLGTHRRGRRTPRQAVAAIVLALAAGSAAAQTVLRWLHIDTDPASAAAYAQVARDFEAAHPGTQVVVQVLENEAYKAKLPTLLQSPERPHVIHSWGGGVLHAQIQAGVVQDISAALRSPWGEAFVPGALAAFGHQGRQWGVPSQMSQVGFFYNRALFAKAGVVADELKTWPQFIEGVKKLRGAGITPIVVGGGDKWPMHFYWTHLALRLGGKAAFEAALRGEAGGFGGPVFVQAGELLKQLADLKPFQGGWQAAAAPASYGQFGDGRGAMTLMGNWLVPQQRTNAAQKMGLADAEMGWFPFPAVPGGRGDARDTLGGVNGWLLTAGAPPLALELLKSIGSANTQRALAERGLIVPAIKGADAALKDPFQKLVAQQLAASTYHQLFYDQMLGPAVGRVVNDQSVELAAGRATPAAAAAAIEQARKR